MTLLNWNEWTWYHYVGASGGVVVILALLLYFTRISRIKVPAILMGIIGGLAVGVALGAAIVIATIVFDIKTDREYVLAGAGPSSLESGGPPGMGKGKMGKGKKGKGMGGAGRGASPQAQLASLVSKLDLLTHRPLAVSLDTEQKKKVRDSLDKLDTEKSLTNEQARAKLESLRSILNEDQRTTLESAGYRWPTQDAAPPTAGAPAAQETPPNPFADGDNKQHLTSLLAELK